MVYVVLVGRLAVLVPQETGENWQEPDVRPASHSPKHLPGRNRFGSIRFGSDFSKINRFGSVRKIRFPGSKRIGLRFSDASWLGLDRFGSFPRPIRAGSESSVRQYLTELSVRFGSVRFRVERFGSVLPVRFGFLSLPDLDQYMTLILKYMLPMK